jgi:hypothetical protein
MAKRLILCEQLRFLIVSLLGVVVEMIVFSHRGGGRREAAEKSKKLSARSARFASAANYLSNTQWEDHSFLL